MKSKEISIEILVHNGVRDAKRYINDNSTKVGFDFEDRIVGELLELKRELTREIKEEPPLNILTIE